MNVVGMKIASTQTEFSPTSVGLFYYSPSSSSVK